MTNDWRDGDKERRASSGHPTDRQWLTNEIHDIKWSIDRCTDQVAELNRRLTKLEESVNGTSPKDIGLGEMKRTVEWLKRIIYGAVGVLMTALLLKTFFNYKG